MSEQVGRVARRANADRHATPLHEVEALESNLRVRRMADPDASPTEPPALKRKLSMKEKLVVLQAVIRADGLPPFERLLLAEVVDRTIAWNRPSYETTQGAVAQHLMISVRQVYRAQSALLERGLIGVKPTCRGVVYWPAMKSMQRELRSGQGKFDLPYGAQEDRT